MIGILDSGVFGLTALGALQRAYPQLDMIYFGDTKSAPLGHKSVAHIIQRSEKGIDFLLSKGVSSILVVSNTISSVALPHLQYTSSYILGLGSVMFQTAIFHSKNKNIGVLGSVGAMESGYYEGLVKKTASDLRLYPVACPLLFSLVADNWLKRRETRMIVKRYLYDLKLKQIDTLILSSPALTPLKSVIQEKAGKRVFVVDNTGGALLSMKAILEKEPHLHHARSEADRRCSIYFSDVSPTVLKMTKMLYGGQEKIDKAIVD